jgi:translocation and assembly module TamB
VRKRTAALLVFLGIVVGLVVATLVVLRTPWAGERVCRAAAARVESATGLRFTFGACRLDVIGLSVEVQQASLAPPAGPPVFSAEAVSAKLAAVQTLGRQLHLAQLTLVKPRVQYARTEPLPATAGLRCPPAFLSRFEIRDLEVQDGAVDVTVGKTRVAFEGVEIRSSPGHRGLRVLNPSARQVRLAVNTGKARLELGARSFEAEGAALDAEVAQNLSTASIARAEVEVGGAKLGVAGKVTNLCNPSLAVEATAEGSVAALAALAGRRLDAEGTASLRVRISGRPAAPELSGHLATHGVRVTKYTLGDAEADLRLSGDALQVERLTVPAQGGKLVARATLKLARGLPMVAQGDFTGVDLHEVLERLGVRDTWVALRLTGRGKVEGTLLPLQLAGEADADGSGFRVFSRAAPAAAAAGEPGVLAIERGHVESKLHIDLSGLYFEGARARIGRGTVRADAAIHFHRADGFQVKASGEVDVDAVGRIAAIPLGGMAEFEARLGAAPYALPVVEARVKTAGFRFLSMSLGTAVGEVRFERPLLKVQVAEGSHGGIRWHGDVAVDLLARPIRLTSSRFQARGRVKELCDAVVDRLPRSKLLREAADGEVEVAGTARGPAAKPDMEFDAQLAPGTLYGRRHDGGRVVGRIRAMEEARFDRAELRRGPGVARATGTWATVPPFPMKIDVAFGDWPLADLDLLPEAAGAVTGTAAFTGPGARPRIAVSATGQKVTWRSLSLGAGKLEAKLDGEHATFSGRGDGLSASGEVTMAGRWPFRVHGELALEDAARLLDDLAPAGLHLRLAGAVQAEGELDAWREARVDARLDRLQASYSDLKIESTAPARLTAARGRWELAPLTLQGPNTSLTVRGARLPGGELEGAATGAFDLRLLSGLLPTLRRSSGQLAVQARFSGTPEDPLVIGSGKVVEAAFLLKGANISFAGVNGALAFSQNKVIFDQLEATVNSGKARLKGELELAKLVPVRLKAEATLDEIPVVVPGFMSPTLSGRLEAEGSPDSTLLTGRLHVVRGRYTQDVDLQGSLLKRKPPPPPRAYDRSGEWLKLDVQLAVDGDVRVDNDLVHGPVTGELTLTGTVAAPGLVGSLAMGRGSRAVFRSNEFELSHAVLDFTDRSKIAVALDVHGESQVRDYQIYLHVFGTLAEPQLKLSSLPDLPEQDIVTLLALGFTRRDAGAQAGVGGVATATAAQALLTASGLDAQVKRFLPRGGPVRDLSMRIVTAYSDETGQVEPRAEIESWLVKDRLRLRFQTPLGAGRGRQAQAELRLGGHTALQYQWDNESPEVPAGDHGVDLKLRWEWTDER